MKIQVDSHYLNRSLDVRYIDIGKQQKLVSKHSLYNPLNIKSIATIDKKGEALYKFDNSNDIVLDSKLSLKRNDENFIILQNFEFVNYYCDVLVKTIYDVNTDYIFTSSTNVKDGCIKARVEFNYYNFPMLSIFESDDIKIKIENLRECLR
jgi:hypothetical protein